MSEKAYCYYCDRDENFQSALVEVCDLPASKVFLCRDQTLAGRCSIMYKEHYERIYEIPKADRDVFMDDVFALAETLQELFHPDNINYAIYGDNVRHVHFNLCPKYKGQLGWGTPFVLFPDEKSRIILPEDEFQARLELVKKTVQAKRMT